MTRQRRWSLRVPCSLMDESSARLRLASPAGGFPIPMTPRWIHPSLLALVSFLAITAIAGGAGLVMRLNAPSTALLQGSPFADYSLPGLVLMVVVGGSALAASVLSLRRRRSAPLWCGLAGVLILCFESVEVLVIGSPPGLARNLQVFYFVLGILIVALALAEFAGGRRRSGNP